jgi:fructokinase
MTGHSVVCIGEALVDMIETTTERGPMFLPAWGGSVMNVACGLARLGTPVAFAGSLSTDALGTRLADFIADQGVSLDLMSATEAPTTIAMTTFVNNEPRYTFYGTPRSYAFIPPAIAARSQVINAPVVHSGSLGVLESMTFDAISEAFRATRGIVTFDPNVRPAMIEDWDEYRRRIGALLHESDVVKFSIEDIEALYPGASADDIAYATLGGGAAAVIVTRAGDGADVFTTNGKDRVPIPTGHTLLDTTGGGDSTMAAIIHQIVQTGPPDGHQGWLHIVSQAMVVAAIVCSRTGGAIAMPNLDEARAAGAAF